eukprot:364999-Chlamydomonas_euryale.AAC.34
MGRGGGAASGSRRASGGLSDCVAHRSDGARQGSGEARGRERDGELACTWVREGVSPRRGPRPVLPARALSPAGRGSPTLSRFQGALPGLLKPSSGLPPEPACGQTPSAPRAVAAGSRTPPHRGCGRCANMAGWLAGWLAGTVGPAGSANRRSAAHAH